MSLLDLDEAPVIKPVFKKKVLKGNAKRAKRRFSDEQEEQPVEMRKEVETVDTTKIERMKRFSKLVPALTEDEDAPVVVEAPVMEALEKDEMKLDASTTQKGEPHRKSPLLVSTSQASTVPSGLTPSLKYVPQLETFFREHEVKLDHRTEYADRYGNVSDDEPAVVEGPPDLEMDVDVIEETRPQQLIDQINNTATHDINKDMYDLELSSEDELTVATSSKVVVPEIPSVDTVRSQLRERMASLTAAIATNEAELEQLTASLDALAVSRHQVVQRLVDG